MSGGASESSGRKVVSALLELAQGAAQQGDYQRVRLLFAERSVAELDREEAEQWFWLLSEAGDLQAAEQLDARFSLGLLKDAVLGAPTVVCEDEVLDFEPAPRTAAASSRSEVPKATVEQFLRWFGGRGDVYAQQWFDSRNERGGYYPVRERLTERQVADHFAGRRTLGQYLLFPDNTVAFAVLDFDPTSAAWDAMRLGESEEGLPSRFPPMREYVERVQRACDELGLPVFCEDTGGLGLHLWFFFQPRTPARRARAILKDVLWRAGSQPTSVQIEVFPKQDELSGKGLGNLVKLPWGLHQATLRRSNFLDAQFRPISPEQFFANVRAISPLQVDQLLQKRVIPLVRRDEEPEEAVEQGQAVSALQPGTSPAALAEALANVAAGKPVQEAVERIIQGCNVVRQLVKQAYEEHKLPADGARSLVYTIGLVGRENSVIDDLLAQAQVSRKELDRVRKGFQPPMGCRRLKQLFPDWARDCSCPNSTDAPYATPVLFAFGEPPRPRSSPEGALFDTREFLERCDSTPQSAPSTPSLQPILERLDSLERTLDRLLRQLGRAGAVPGRTEGSEPRTLLADGVQVPEQEGSESEDR